MKRVYIGKTNDLKRRLKEHNGQKKGGAIRTKKFRPWEFAAICYGFENDIEAQKFEAVLTYPYSCRFRTGFAQAELDLTKRNRIVVAEWLAENTDEYAHIRVARNLAVVEDECPNSFKKRDKMRRTLRTNILGKMRKLKKLIYQYRKLVKDPKRAEPWINGVDNTLASIEQELESNDPGLPAFYFDDIVDLTEQ